MYFWFMFGMMIDIGPNVLHSTFHTPFLDLKVNVTDLEPIGRAYPIVDHLSSRPYVHTCVRPYVRKPFLVITSPRTLVGFFKLAWDVPLVV